MTFKSFIASFPRGAYTSARTYRQRAVFEYDEHVARLARSVDLMCHSEAERAALHWVTDPATLEPFVRRECRAAIEYFIQQTQKQTAVLRTDSSSDEMKLTLLIAWNRSELPAVSPPDGSNLTAPVPSPADGIAAAAEAATVTTVDGVPAVHFWTLCQRLLPRPTAPVVVECMGHPRHNAKAKDSAWVLDRTALEQAMSKDANEVLLSDDAGNITEGLSSNFFVVRYVDGDGGLSADAPRPFVLYTASNALEGTVRKLILQICSSLSIPVVLDRNLNVFLDLPEHHWDECFISSTSRLILPIRELRQDSQQFLFKDPSVSHWLCDRLLKEMESVSRSILP